VLADLSLATRLTMVTLVRCGFMTVGGPAIGSALFAYGVRSVDANYWASRSRFSFTCPHAWFCCNCGCSTRASSRGRRF